MAGLMTKAETLVFFLFSGALVPLLVVFVSVIDWFSQVKATPVMTEYTSNPRQGLTEHYSPMTFVHCSPSPIQLVHTRFCFENREFYSNPRKPSVHVSHYNVLLERSSIQLSPPPPSADPIQQRIPHREPIPTCSASHHCST